MDPRLRADLHLRLTRLDLRARLEVGDEVLALVGPSGAGKTSLLRAIAGLLRQAEGRVAFGGEVWLDTAAGVARLPEKRPVGLVFQQLALFPHLTVERNVAYGLRGRRNRAGARAKVNAALERFGIAGLASARPRSRSGGERQRVALARAVAADPSVLLLDEPLSALDPETKGRVAAELEDHLRALSLPTVLVSHDFSDVVGLADRVAVLEGGRIVQSGTGADLLEAPASSFVAAFTGVNYLAGVAVRRGELTEVHASGGPATFLSTDPLTGPVAAVVYPWEVALSPHATEGSALNALAGPVRRVAGVGNRVRVTVGSQPVVVAELTTESAHRMGLSVGVPVVASWKATGTRLVARAGD